MVSTKPWNWSQGKNSETDFTDNSIVQAIKEKDVKIKKL